jgi:predicted DNA-binding protein
MIRGKTRHQLFLPDELSRRLTAMATRQKRSRSDLLLEMVEA